MQTDYRQEVRLIDRNADRKFEKFGNADRLQTGSYADGQKCRQITDRKLGGQIEMQTNYRQEARWTDRNADKLQTGSQADRQKC